MKQFIKQFIRSRCEVIIDEENITKVLRVLNKHGINSNLSIGNCGWKESNMWYIMFTSSGKRMTSIRSELKKENFREIMIFTNTNEWVKVEKLIQESEEL